MLSKTSNVNDTLGPNIATQIHQKTTARYNQELRAELFHTEKGIRKLYHKCIIYENNVYI